MQFGALVIGGVGIGLGLASIAGYRKPTRWEHALPARPKTKRYSEQAGANHALQLEPEGLIPFCYR